MRDSFGGSFMFKLLIIFIITFVVLMAAALNYSKVFRVKNHVINILEQYQYTGGENSRNDRAALDAISSYLPSVSYVFPRDNSVNIRNHCSKEGQDAVYIDGVCIIPKGTVNNGRYYKVITYLDFRIGGFFDLSIPVAVSGETKVIRY